MDYNLKNVRAAAILTNSYVAGTVIGPVQNQDQLIVYYQATKGSLTDIDIKVEFSPDNTTWYQETAEAVSGEEATLNPLHRTIDATENGRFLVDIADRYIRISALGNGTVTSSSLTIDAVIARRYGDN